MTNIMTYDEIEIDYLSINHLRINNLIYFQSKIWKINEIDDFMLYLSNPSSNDIGVPISEINAILITPEIMSMCGFLVYEIEDTPQYYIGKDSIQTKITYQLFNEEFGIDIMLKVIMNYKLKNDEYFMEVLDVLDKGDKKLLWLHQIQNLFKDIYKFELIDID